MRHPILAGLLVALMWPAAALASEEPDAELSAILEACVKAAATADDPSLAGRTCIGKAAETCMERPGGYGNLAMAQCASLELNWWDKKLNRHWAELKEQLEPGSYEALLKAQRHWIAFKDADCQWVYDHQFGEGSMRIPTSAFCMMDATAVRALKLGEMVLEQ